MPQCVFCVFYSSKSEIRNVLSSSSSKPFSCSLSVCPLFFQSAVCSLQSSQSSICRALPLHLQSLLSAVLLLRRRSVANAFSHFCSHFGDVSDKVAAILRVAAFVPWAEKKNSSSRRIVATFWLRQEPIPFSISAWKWKKKHNSYLQQEICVAADLLPL